MVSEREQQVSTSSLSKETDRKNTKVHKDAEGIKDKQVKVVYLSPQHNNLFRFLCKAACKTLKLYRNTQVETNVVLPAICPSLDPRDPNPLNIQTQRDAEAAKPPERRRSADTEKCQAAGTEFKATACDFSIDPL